MMRWKPLRAARILAAALFSCAAALAVSTQQPSDAAILKRSDAAIRARFEHVLGFTVIEHYAVFRNHDETHPVAEMTVKTLYRKDSGKSYTILSQSGPAVLRNFVLVPLLDNEKRINDPASREASWFTSANYEMKLEPGGTRRLNGHDCFVVSMTPRRKAPNMIDGTMWVDAKDYSTVQIQGVSSKSPSVFAGPTQMMRQYALVGGYAQAVHARAVSNSLLFGQTVITIDYRDYQVQLLPTP